MRRKRRTDKGFTLVELASVLVIIGLIVGGVVVGQNLIRSAEMNSILTDVDKFKSAISLFDQKYNALPGDFKTAESYWGTDPNGCPNGTAGTTTKATTTCNGDGNGFIGNWRTMTGTPEFFRSWQQLSAAGMIQESFTGVTGTGSAYQAMMGYNVPSSRIQGGGYTLAYSGYYAGDVQWWADDYGHVFLFGAFYTNSATMGPLLTTEEAYSFDYKADDGKPATGNIIAFKSTSTVTPGCVTTAVASTAVYAVSTAGRLCSLVFKKVVPGDAQ